MRTLLATVGGILISIIVVKLIEMGGHKLFPFTIEINTLEDFKALAMNMPVKALIPIILAHGIGTLTGMFFSRMIERKVITPLFFIGGAMLLLSILNVVMLTHPTWFVIADIGIIVLVSAIYIYSRLKKV